MKECFGKRWKAYPKCKDCKDVMNCSIITLERKFGDKAEVIA